MKLSFIVPIYNVEPYLRKCVDSLLNQNYEDYEIILVDDGSTDGSGAMADAIAEKWELRTENRKPEVSVRVIHQENRGLSGARNTGIAAARGEYICFVDSDDYWEENVLGGLMAQIERDQLDVLRFRWQNVRENGEVFNPYSEENFADFSEKPLSGMDFLDQRMGIQCYACMFILKKDLTAIEKFKEGILFEDTDWTPRVLAIAHMVAGTETIVYNYLWRETGITHGKDLKKIKKELEDKISLISRLKVLGNSQWYKSMISALVVSIFNILSAEMYKNKEEYLLKLKELDIYPLSLYGLNKKARRKAKLINICPLVAIWMIHIKR